MTPHAAGVGSPRPQTVNQTVETLGWVVLGRAVTQTVLVCAGLAHTLLRHTQS
jgi:hypothetical protein